MINKHLPNLVAFLQLPTLYAAIKRNLVRFLETMDLPEDLQGPLLNLCFRIIEIPCEAIECKSFALSNLHRLSLQYTDIIPEIKSLIEARLPFEPKFCSRCKMTVLSEISTAEQLNSVSITD